MNNWESSLAAFRLMEVGSAAQALANASEPTLREVITLRCGQRIESSLPVVQGWQQYFQANYSAAVTHFSEQPGEGWLRAWADLGIAKVASDCGFWRSALEWCALAWQRAAAGEHMDLLAEISGARGEILLRSGKPSEAASSFAEDLALLRPGSRYSGRVRCYLAHAWSRMGNHAGRAARLFYQLAAHTASEPGTRSYSAAGLAVHGVRIREPFLVAEAEESAPSGMPGFWVRVCKAKLETSTLLRKKSLEEAMEILPPEYHAEHWWARGWLSGSVPDSKFLEPLHIHPLPPANLGVTTLVEMPVSPDAISDAPWWDKSKWPTDAEGWWKLRDNFMP